MGRLTFIVFWISLAALWSITANAAGPATRAADVRWSEAVNGLSISCDIGGRPTYNYSPGESATFHASVRNLSDGPLLVDVGDAHHATLHVRLPDGREFIHSTWDPKFDKLRGARLQTLGPKQQISVMRWKFSFGDEAEGWRDPKTGEPAKDISFRAEGDYLFWIDYAIEKNNVGAWVGALTAAPVKIILREIPVEKRLMTPTVEQLAALQAFYLDPQRTAPIEEYMARTENEGFALHLLDEAEKRPGLRGRLVSLVSRRAGIYEGDPTINGPYLKRLAEMNVAAMEEEPATHLSKATREYLKLHPEEKALPARMIAVAKQWANLETLYQRERAVLHGGVAPPARDGSGRMGIGAAWYILIQLGALHDGMTVEEATAILGPPAETHEKGLSWYYESPRHVNPALSVRLENGKLFQFNGYNR